MIRSEEHKAQLKTHMDAMAEMIASGKASEDHPAWIAAKPFLESLTESQLSCFHQGLHREAAELAKKQ